MTGHPAYWLALLALFPAWAGADCLGAWVARRRATRRGRTKKGR